jgi:GT2 family glycosyltransferase
MNGNIVLVPQSVVNEIGIIDPTYHHELGDIDYGLSARNNGIKIFSTGIAIAFGYPNSICRLRKPNTTLKNRLRQLYSPIGANPVLHFYFRKKHFGIANASAYWLYLHFLNFLPDRIVTVICGKCYP